MSDSKTAYLFHSTLKAVLLVQTRMENSHVEESGLGSVILTRFDQSANLCLNLDDSGLRVIADVGMLLELLPEPVLHYSQQRRQRRVPLECLLPWS